jgi:ribonuclease Z
MTQNQIRARLSSRMMRRRQQAMADIPRQLLRKDAITVVLVGTGGPLPSTRSQYCTAVFVNGKFLLFDAGDGSSRRMMDLNLPYGDLDTVFMTHYHADHFADLGEVIDRSWIAGRRHTLAIHGPPGIEQIVAGFHQAYTLEYGYRTAHHGTEIMPPAWAKAQAMPFQYDANGTPVVVFDEDGVQVSAFAASHPPIEPNVGYRIDFAGQSIVLASDSLPTETLLAQSKDAEVLVANVMNMDAIQQMQTGAVEMGNSLGAHILYDIQDYHMGLPEMGKLAQKAGVKRLALTHLSPPVEQKYLANRLFRRPVAAHYAGEIVVGEDGMQIVLPVT